MMGGMDPDDGHGPNMMGMDPTYGRYGPNDDGYGPNDDGRHGSNDDGRHGSNDDGRHGPNDDGHGSKMMGMDPYMMGMAQA